MLRLTKLNGASIYVNPDLVRTIEQTPDTMLAMTDGQKLVVKESPEEVVDRLVEYRRRIVCDMPAVVRSAEGVS